jgi:hypothetical protein
MTRDLTFLWAQTGNELAKFFGVVPHVFQEGDGSYAFRLGNYEAYRVLQRQKYILITYTDWENGGSSLKQQDDRSSKSLIDAVQRFNPSVVENLEANRTTIKKLKAIN